MRRFALALLVAAACGGKGKQAPEGGGNAEPILAKKIAVSWGITQQASAAELYLQLTDETGKQVSHPLGTYPGQCAAMTPAPEMKAVIGVACKDGATGVELHAVARDTEVIVVKMRVDDGVAPDPMAREEVTRVATPLGAAIIPG
jgi:hypothetical protein